MKLLFLVYDVDFEEEVQEALKEAGLGEYTLWERVLGKGSRTGPRLDTSAWPGFNQLMMIVLSDERWEKVRHKISKLTQRPGIRGFLWECEEVRG
jgi:nitrogen regulatory protein PII